ncbi:hypothetical protein Lpp46_2130 [Lacticaseibacillus paracasei subsp. paracasei Lpp46]|nr:hypothetical protein Lpp46_2130 [Lacticaseibacillus paracasei subsp. paracasei Lpp46]
MLMVLIYDLLAVMGIFVKVDNEPNAISLGKENAETRDKIKIIEDKIDTLKNSKDLSKV